MHEYGPQPGGAVARVRATRGGGGVARNAIRSRCYMNR